MRRRDAERGMYIILKPIIVWSCSPRRNTASIVYDVIKADVLRASTIGLIVQTSSITFTLHRSFRLCPNSEDTEQNESRYLPCRFSFTFSYKGLFYLTFYYINYIRYNFYYNAVKFLREASYSGSHHLPGP